MATNEANRTTKKEELIGAIEPIIRPVIIAEDGKEIARLRKNFFNKTSKTEVVITAMKMFKGKVL